MAKTGKQIDHYKGSASIFAVAFLSSSLTLTLAGAILLALNFGYAGGLQPIMKYLDKLELSVGFAAPQPAKPGQTVITASDVKDIFAEKTNLNSSVVFKSQVLAQPEEVVEVAAVPEEPEPAPAAMEASLEEPEENYQQPSQMPEGIPVILRRKSNGSGVEIGNFRSVTMDGAAEECLNMGYSMLSAARAREDMLDIMVANKQITIASICASNGKVVFSCRNGRISISPRRSRPDDYCSRV